MAIAEVIGLELGIERRSVMRQPWKSAPAVGFKIAGMRPVAQANGSDTRAALMVEQLAAMLWRDSPQAIARRRNSATFTASSTKARTIAAPNT